MIADEPAGGLPRLVRAMAASSMGLALVAAVVALLPGSADYEDTSRCFAQALGNLGQMEHHPACEPTWRFIGTRPAGGLALATLMSLFVAGLPLLWMRERLRLLLAWSVVVLAAVAAAAIGVVVTFELDFHFNRRTDSLWPARVLPFLVVAAIICALAVLLTCAIGRRRNRRVRA